MTIKTPLPEPEPAANPAVEKVDWKDFRDHLATADQEGHGSGFIPRKPHGRFYRARTL